MRFGLLYEAQRPFQGTSVDWNTLYKETLEQCVLAEKVGFDNLWFVEHHFLTGFSGSPCPEVLLGALRLILAGGIYIPPDILGRVPPTATMPGQPTITGLPLGLTPVTTRRTMILSFEKPTRGASGEGG